MTSKSALIGKTILAHLRDSGQLSELVGVVDYLRSSTEYKSSRNLVVVTSATELSASDLQAISTYLHKTIGDSYELEQQLDPTLVAGFTLQLNDTFIDASVLGKINMVQNKLTAKE